MFQKNAHSLFLNSLPLLCPFVLINTACLQRWCSWAFMCLVRCQQIVQQLLGSSWSLLSSLLSSCFPTCFHVGHTKEKSTERNLQCVGLRQLLSCAWQSVHVPTGAHLLQCLPVAQALGRGWSEAEGGWRCFQSCEPCFHCQTWAQASISYRFPGSCLKGCKSSEQIWNQFGAGHLVLTRNQA